jgi:hypothetical protein
MADAQFDTVTARTLLVGTVAGNPAQNTNLVGVNNNLNVGQNLGVGQDLTVKGNLITHNLQVTGMVNGPLELAGVVRDVATEIAQLHQKLDEVVNRVNAIDNKGSSVDPIGLVIDVLPALL